MINDEVVNQVFAGMINACGYVMFTIFCLVMLVYAIVMIYLAFFKKDKNNNE